MEKLVSKAFEIEIGWSIMIKPEIQTKIDVSMAQWEITKFMNLLEYRADSPTVCNMYHDPHLRANLTAYLTFMHTVHPKILLVGEAPGYQGCRKTGIPFTSGYILVTHLVFRDIPLSKGMSPKWKEPTAAMIYETMTPEIFHKVMFWNAFPFHPHEENQPESNRRPTAQEIEEGRSYLLLLEKIFGFSRLVGIGEVGTAAVQSTTTGPVTRIRHPSHGGKAAFLQGFQALLKEE